MKRGKTWCLFQKITVQDRFPVGIEQMVKFEVDVIGEMSLLDKLTRSASVVAVQSTKVYHLSRESFDEMLVTHKDLSIKFLLGLASLLSLRLRNTSGWFADVF